MNEIKRALTQAIWQSARRQRRPLWRLSAEAESKSARKEILESYCGEIQHQAPEIKNRPMKIVKLIKQSSM